MSCQIGVWNIRGMNAVGKVEGIVELVHRKNLSLIAAVETKVWGGNPNLILNRLCNHWSFCHNSNGQNKARIMVFWDSTALDVQILNIQKQAIHLDVTMFGSNTKFYLTCIYASNARTERKYLWLFIRSLSTSIKAPWALLGDFNTCKEMGEKVGGTLLQANEIRDFRECVNETNLYDISSTGCFYTWSNRSSDGRRRTLTRIYRVLINDEWAQVFEHTFANFLPQGISDHSAIVIKWKSSTHSTVTPFKFFNHWTSHPEFQAIVEKSWRQNETGNPMMRLTAKLKRLKEELKIWSKIHFSKLGTRTAAAKASLERIQLEIQARPTDLLLAVMEKAAMKNYSELAQVKEASIRQKAKEDMSQFGDQNTAYYHRKIKSRRAKNRILSLIDDNDNKLIEDHEIKVEAVNYFGKLMGTEPETAYENRLEDFNFEFQTIQHEEADNLELLPTHEEIKMAIFDIEDCKSLGPDGFTSLLQKVLDFGGE
ncbi:Dnase i-like superfamily protein [Thalictrum thalictroides]|uniref:Dnase i-like superfamily protein n=1 Tax=Thalictrum thalictroides TaxID=46969 RepID=A0A7J6WL56_THATH|nr:Dnase i-like superfamily protein [Thalictrum thalictroides]